MPIDPAPVVARMRSRGLLTLDDLFDRVVVCPSGCWLWTGADSGNDPSKGGYGRVLPPGVGRRTPEAAHRYVYRMFKKSRPIKIPEGYDIDHLCRHWTEARFAYNCRRCVNPDHLEAVRPAVNQERRRLDFVMDRIRNEYALEAMECA